MKEFDQERAEYTVELIVDRDAAAGLRFAVLLNDLWPDTAHKLQHSDAHAALFYCAGRLLDPTVGRLYVIAVCSKLEPFRPFGLRPAHNDVLTFEASYHADMFQNAAADRHLHSQFDFVFAVHKAAHFEKNPKRGVRSRRLGPETAGVGVGGLSRGAQKHRRPKEAIALAD
ncbi:MAG: hypothetical protein ACLQF1_22000 [Methyloceanibacter sp.]